jgi:hypothetical protein
VPSVVHSVNKLFIERRTLPSATLGKVFFVECPIKSTRQSRRHSAKARIPVVALVFETLFLHEARAIYSVLNSGVVCDPPAAGIPRLYIKSKQKLNRSIIICGG